MAGELEKVEQPQTIPAYMPNGDFVGFLAPQAYKMFMQRVGNGGGTNYGELLSLGSDAALAGYQLFSIGQLDSDFAFAKKARKTRFEAKAALLASASSSAGPVFAAALGKFLSADDEMSFYQNRVIDGQLKGFWASALAAGGRALGDLIGGGGMQGGGGGDVSTWVMAGGSVFLLATLFDRRGGDRHNNNPTGYQE